MNKPMFAIVFLLFAMHVTAHTTAPVARPDGGKWRVAYVESGYYIDYQLNLFHLINALSELGWVQPAAMPEPGSNQQPLSMWEYVCQHVHSDYLQFLPDAAWSYNWDEQHRERNTADMLRRLQSGDIDLLLSFGTWAGQAAATNAHHVPTLVISTSDPIRAGIITSAEDSGYDHITAQVHPDRFLQQLRVFHNTFHFKKLGIVYEDTQTGRSYAAIEDVRAVAAECGFEVIEYHCITDHPDLDHLYTELQKAYDYLAPRVDAMYLTENSAHMTQRMPALMKPFEDNKVPTFYQSGAEGVEMGALMSLATEDFTIIARFNAEKLARILHGELPRSLPQVVLTPPRLAVNLQEADRIGWNVPLDILKLCDEIYTTIPSGDAAP